MANKCIGHMLHSWATHPPKTGGWFETTSSALGWKNIPKKDKILWDPLVKLLKQLHSSGKLCSSLDHHVIETVSVMWAAPGHSVFHIDDRQSCPDALAVISLRHLDSRPNIAGDMFYELQFRRNAPAEATEATAPASYSMKVEEGTMYVLQNEALKDWEHKVRMHVGQKKGKVAIRLGFRTLTEMMVC